ncbi:ABC transporter substrate-binding protein [Bacteroides sp. 519]|uniref:ABC transporter substrate-binding protein n=1 Tax=Bacteroides sp. 519 TaxID=2302937 RepID=UPI0013D7D0D6|nr:MetQ/NlpA family ABC transporter substrate-binding protein [Bacteroides sp. 519]NDV58464.1 hypothetical protein [Bacteroides sp. 519]
MKKLLSFVLLLILLVSCYTRKHTELQPLTIGILIDDDYSLPPTLTNDSIGLQVKVIRFLSSAERDSALYAGKIDGIVTDYLNAAILQANGAPLQIAMKNDTSFHLVAGIGNGIRSLELLKGRNIAVEKNTIIEYITDCILQSVNIPTDTGVNKADIKRASLRLNLLQNGLIDASVLPGQLANIAIENGNYSLFDLEESTIPAIVTLFSNQSLNNKQQEIEVFVKEHKASAPSQDEITHVIQWLKQKELIK